MGDEGDGERRPHNEEIQQGLNTGTKWGQERTVGGEAGDFRQQREVTLL